MLKKHIALLLLLLSGQLFAQEGNYLSLPVNGYVEMYNYTSVTSMQSGTISFWFKIGDLNTTTFLFSASDEESIASGTYDDFFIVYRPVQNCIQVAAHVNGVTKMDAYNPYNSIADNNWHNCTVVSDNANAIEIYLDGVAQTLTAGLCCGGTTADYLLGDVVGITNMKIGALKRNAFLTSGSASIDDFRIWDKALSSSEVASTIAAVSTPPVSNLIVYYTCEIFENLSTGNAGANDIRDQTGNTVHGDVINANIDFSLAPECYIEVDNYSALLSLQSGTISFWFKIGDLNSTTFLFSTSDEESISSGTYDDFFIVYRPVQNCIQVAAHVNGVTKMDAYNPYNSIIDNNWHNCTVVSDNANAIEIYLDGVAQTLTAGPCCGGTTADYFLGDVVGATNMKIGALKRDGFLPSGSVTLDDFRIWDKALSSSEVTSTIASVSTPPVTNLVLYYNFDDIQNLNVGNSGQNDVEDVTGNGQHGDRTCGITTGVDYAQVDQSANLIVYPNPATDLVNVQLEIQGAGVVNGKLMDSSGRIIMSWSESTTDKYNKQLNFSALSPGIYFIQLTGDTTSKSVKVVKQ